LSNSWAIPRNNHRGTLESANPQIPVPRKVEKILRFLSTTYRKSQTEPLDPPVILFARENLPLKRNISMASIRQIEANRLNAQKSTGPNTEKGKAISRMNALKTGVYAMSETIHGEDTDHLDALTAEYFDRWQPATPEERCLVDTLIRSEWQLRRLAKADSQLWDYQIANVYRRCEQYLLGQIFSNNSTNLLRIQRRIDAVQRGFRTTLADLERLQAARQAAEPEQEPDPTPAPALKVVETKPGSPPIGFVPSSPVGQASWPVRKPTLVGHPPATPKTSIGFVPSTPARACENSLPCPKS
jgi:hypothetical protein